MVNAKFTADMRKILTGLVGTKFISYECGQDEFSRSFGNMRINTDAYSIELTNEEQVFPLYDGNEDMTCFACKKVNAQDPFKPDAMVDTYITDVCKTITSIEMITDIISVNDGAYEITFDMALIFHMGNDVLMLARDTWFSELISIRDNDDYESIFPVKEEEEAWANDGEYDVDVQRIRTVLL